MPMATAPVRTHRVAAEGGAIHHRWSPDIPPVLEVQPGDSVIVETRTGDDGQLRPGAGPEAVEHLDFSRLHALTGPIAIRGARPGDVLGVRIEEIVTEPWGFVMARPGAGVLRGFQPYLRFVDLDQAGGRATFAPGIWIPIRPFLGIMGVAPSEGELRTIEPGDHGGNLDCRELGVGATLYVRVQVPGANFSCGDGHAAQGDGEVCVTAIECGLTTRLRLELYRPLLDLHNPLAETAEGWLTLAAAPTVEEAVAEALSAMIELITTATDLSPGDAYALSSAAVDVRINQLVNGSMRGVRAVLPRDVLDIERGAILAALPPP
jgi:acetamidase/formamidase